MHFFLPNYIFYGVYWRRLRNGVGMAAVEFPYWILLAVVPLFVLLGVAFNYKRGDKWEDQRRRHGAVHCRACGYVGELVVRSLSAENASSANLRLVCDRCDSSDWFVPDDEKTG